jgi:hypothetical protein
VVNRKNIPDHGSRGAFPAEIAHFFRCFIPHGIAKNSTFSTPHPQAVRFYDPSIEIA